MRTRDQIISVGTSQVISTALGIIFSVLAARGLGPALRGQFFLIQAYFTVASMLFGLSTSTIMTVQTSRGEFQLAEVHSAAVLLSLLLGGTGGILALVVFLNTAGTRGLSMSILACYFLAMPATLYKTNWSAIFLGLGRIGQMNIVTILDSLLMAVAAAMALFVLHLGLDGMLLLLTVQSVVIGAIGIFLAARASRFSWRFSRKCIVELLSQGWKQHVATTASQLYLRVDAFILAAFLSPAALGEYALARGVSERILIAFTPISQVMFPLISSCDPERAKEHAQSAFRQVAGMGILVTLTAILAFPVLIPLVYGNAYRDAVILTQVLSVAFVVIGVMVPVNLWFVGSLRRPDLNALTCVVTLVLILGLGYAFVPRGGGLVMAVATLVSFACTLAFTIWLANSKGLGLHRYFPNPGELRAAFVFEVERLRAVTSRKIGNREIDG